VVERLRAPLAATVALLIGGELAARGAGALTDVWGWLFPYLFLFLLFEVLRARRRLLDVEAFMLGAAVGLLRDGVYSKTLQDGALPLGLDVLGAVVAAFDWGLTAVVSLHVVDALLPRREERRDDLRERLALVVIAAAVFVVYAFRTATDRYLYERMLGATWLLGDLLFAGAAAALTRRAWCRAAEEDPPEPDRWLWALAAFCAWLPGAQLLHRLFSESSAFFEVFFLFLWTLLAAWLLARLWMERGHVDVEPSRAARPVLAVAAWRLAAVIALTAAFGAASDDPRAPGAFQLFVDLPTRLAFVAIFFSTRLAV